MLRRFLTVLGALLLLSPSALAQSAPPESSQAQSFPVPPIRARAAVVMNASNGAILAALNPHMRLPMASTTKIMTALVALQHGSLDDRITVPKSAFDFESDATVMGLHPNQVVTLRDLLYGLMLPSGADAANTIAIHYGGSEAHFAQLMNQEAVLLGMHDTHYSNAHGLTSVNHYSSAYDLALLAQYVSYMPALMQIAGTRSYRWSGHVLTNLNKVLFWYPGADGLKPGYTNEAGICQVLDVRRDGRHIVAVLLHTPDLNVDARNLLNFGVQDYAWVQSQMPGDNPTFSQSGQDAAEAYVYYPASGHYVHGRFLGAYRANGGLSGLGFPRTEALREGGNEVQYYQNGALSLNPATGHVTRLALGLTPIPATPPARAAQPTAVPPPSKAMVLPARWESRVAQASKVTPIPVPRATPTRVPSSGPTPTVTPTPPILVARVFQKYASAHRALLGAPTANARTIHGYLVQQFAYAALIHDAKHNAVLLLPLGDRLLAARHFVPSHPGNSYPATFAPVSLLKAIGWIPSQRDPGVSR